MKTVLSLMQADAYAEAHTRSWTFIFALREAVGLEKGQRFDWADAFDIINGYGFENPNTGVVLSTDDILVGGDRKRVDGTEFHYVTGSCRLATDFWDSKRTFDIDDLRFCLAILQDRYWMLVYSKGTEEVSRDLKVAYRFRKSLLERLDNFQW